MTSEGGARSVRCTVAGVVKEVEAALASAGECPARGAAIALVAACLRQPRWWPSLHRDDELDDSHHTELLNAARRVAEGTPLAYAVGHADFRTLTLEVNDSVLIPRPETELLVDLVLRGCSDRRGGIVADVGTGSGAIALSLAVEGSFERVLATDVSADALTVATRNARSLQPILGERVEFRHGESLAPLSGERLDVLVSNPPYIAYSELAELPSLVRDWEPPNALVCHENGLAVTRSIVDGAGSLFVMGGLLALEIDSRRGREVLGIVSEAGGYSDIVLHHDLTGRERFVTARWTG
jgi:release factor glutamine methyltransferase